MKIKLKQLHIILVSNVVYHKQDKHLNIHKTTKHKLLKANAVCRISNVLIKSTTSLSFCWPFCNDTTRCSVQLSIRRKTVTLEAKVFVIRKMELARNMLMCVVPSAWSLVLEFAGSNPAEAVGFFSGEKIFSMPSFRREVKPFAPCRRFAACKKSL
jgi:hypothetical protein